MRKWLHMGVLFLCVLLLCACKAPNVEDGSTPDPTYEDTENQNTEIATLPATDPPETTQQTSKETDPPHSELYISGISTPQMLEYFQEVALDMEYTDGPGDTSLIQKWMGPIYYRVYGAPTEEDMAVLNALFVQLNEIPGFPGIYAAEEGTLENLSIGFWDPETFDYAFSDTLNGEDAYGAMQFWYYTDTNEIHTGRIGYRTDIDQNTRTSILIEEIINLLGFSDTELRTDSVVYQYSNENTELSDVDWVLVRLLYDPAIQCGMNYDSCAAVIQSLYY